MTTVTLEPVQTTILTSDEELAKARVRLDFHRAVLQQHGIELLSSLGTLRLPKAVAAEPGVVTAPSVQGGPVPGPFATTPIGIMRPVLDDQGNIDQLEPDSAEAVVLPPRQPVNLAEPPVPSTLPSIVLRSAPMAAPITTFAAPIALGIAYFVAQTIELPDDSVVILRQPHMYLVFIAEKLIVGKGVTFTHERPTPTAPTLSFQSGAKPPKPPRAPTPNSIEGVTGEPGKAGQPGGKGWDGVNAPEMEMWCLDMEGSPIFDLEGQDGGDGGRGQDGGDGGDGSIGRAEQYDWLGFCRSGAGSGGNGGPGGNGGNGGLGGAGGTGGRLNLYAPQPVLLRYAAGGFSISTKGGNGGKGGSPGFGGRGGEGGPLGDSPRNCARLSGQTAGVKGEPDGQPGHDGDTGPDGSKYADAVRFVGIDADDFQRMLTAPALLSCVPARGVVGASVTVSGLRLTKDDALLLDAMPTPVTIIGDTLASFTVPAVRGGYRILQIRRANGTLSNRLSFYVVPQVITVGTGERIRPGSTVSVVGSGFAEGARVRINGEDMPDATFISDSAMAFTLHRPANTVENPDGEVGELSVILSDGTPSNTVSFIIDTLRVVVLGDSVAWGQGLRDHEKFSKLVEQAIAARNGGIHTYTTMLAHSGAVIGVNDNTELAPLDGEVPTSYPTVLQQVQNYVGAAEAVDLVLITAGICDLNFRTVVNPVNTPKTLAPSITQYCYRDLRTLLERTAARFPNATIVATSYFPMISEESDTNLLSAFAIALGVALGGLPATFTASLLPRIATNCRAFYELSSLAIKAAVDDVNESLPTSRILFADPQFGPSNAALAPNAWLYGVNADLSSQDIFVAGERGQSCELNSSRTDLFICRRASVGHPNPAGAKAYADAILAALDRGFARVEDQLPPFPPGFLWGVATAAMQNEGGITNNDWAMFVGSPAIRRRVRALTQFAGGDPVDITPPDEAIREADLTVLEADLDRAAGLGINAYRFSVEWARVQPGMANHTNPLTDTDVDMAAVAYYDHVLDALEARGLTPILTLNHLTLPDWVLNPPKEATILSAFGLPTANGDDPDFRNSLRGWENETTVAAYLEFVRYLVTRWKDRVRWWITVNEPVGSMVGLGYVAGIWPPGFTGDGDRAKLAYFNLIRAHARAYETIKAINNTAMVGLAHAMLDAKVTTAVVDHIFGDQEAARNQFDYFYNWHFLNAVIDGRVDIAISRRPQNQTNLEGQALSDFFGFVIDQDHPWKSHCDYIGLNYYRSVYVYADAFVSAFVGFTGGRFANNLAGGDQTHQILNDLGWEISPGGFGTILQQLHDRYNLPILVTENGLPQATDRHRGAFITAHLQQILDAVANDVGVRGYVYWTLADNWEWHEDYRPQSRFGLFTIDRDDRTLPRNLTDGAYALQYIISRGTLAGSTDLFGTITPAGDRVIAPRRSPAAFTGTLNGEAIRLRLYLDPDGKVRGVMHETTRGRVLPLVGQADTTLGTINLAQAAISDTPAGMMTGQRQVQNGQISLSGTLIRGGQTLIWTITRDTLAGEWAGSEPFRHFRLTQQPNNSTLWIGGWLPDDLPRGWEPMSVEVANGGVTLEAAGYRFRGSLVGSTLTGQISMPISGFTGPWTASRLDDGLNF
jgi:beta-glucosidase/6-phospho-beta-glucosidase/beta-galactosidase